MLRSMTVAQVPYMKPRAYRELHKKLHKQAYPRTHSGEVVSSRELVRMLKAGKI